MSKRYTDVHYKLEQIDVSLKKFREDFSISNGGFYNALEVMYGEGKMTNKMNKYVMIIKNVLNLKSRTAYDKYVEDYVNGRLDDQVKETFEDHSTHPVDTSEVALYRPTAEEYLHTMKSHAIQIDNLNKKHDLLQEEIYLLKSLLKFYMNKEE